jgi:transcriptional regulator with XRE-family HTH domain
MCRRIKGLRVHAGLTQMQAAEALCVSQAAYSRLEKGEVEISLTKLFVLSELYGISLHKLIEGI